jgi:transcriptional regulator with XRE-family HTH domain
MLRALVKDMGYTMREVCHEIDFSESTLHYWASGKAPIPHYAREKLAPLLACSIEDLAPRPQYDVLLRGAIQAPDVVAMLTALVEQPEVQRGLLMAREFFLDSYGPAPLIEEDMIYEVETNLSRRAHERQKAANRVLGEKASSSYLCDLGCVLGMIGQGFVYARSSSEGQAPLEKGR